MGCERVSLTCSERTFFFLLLQLGCSSEGERRQKSPVSDKPLPEGRRPDIRGFLFVSRYGLARLRWGFFQRFCLLLRPTDSQNSVKNKPRHTCASRVEGPGSLTPCSRGRREPMEAFFRSKGRCFQTALSFCPPSLLREGMRKLGK